MQRLKVFGQKIYLIIVSDQNSYFFRPVFAGFAVDQQSSNFSG
jgi:hypothetical protein